MSDARDEGAEFEAMREMARRAAEIAGRRRFERMKAGLEIRYRVVGPTEEATLLRQGGYAPPESFRPETPETQDLARAVSEDISLGGLRINTPTPLPEGTRLWLQVGLPGVPIPVNALAEVRWSRAQGADHGSGLKFTGISAPDVAKVERYLALQKPQPKRPGSGA